MILVLEGAEGTGKTSLATALVERHGFVSYRTMAWKDGRQSPHQLSVWRERGVPVNTFVDDIYAADLLACLASNIGLAWTSRIVLDRSMPSGVAYAPEGPQAHAQAVAWWARTLTPIGGRIVLLDAPVENLLRRLPEDDPRRCPERLARVRSTLADAVSLASCLPTLRLNVGEAPYWDGFSHEPRALEERVTDWLGL
jgi:thymidylate kinase